MSVFRILTYYWNFGSLEVRKVLPSFLKGSYGERLGRVAPALAVGASSFCPTVMIIMFQFELEVLLVDSLANGPSVVCVRVCTHGHDFMHFLSDVFFLSFILWRRPPASSPRMTLSVESAFQSHHFIRRMVVLFCLIVFCDGQAPDHGVESTPAPHAHWTLYEALQQPMAIARALAFGGEGGGILSSRFRRSCVDIATLNVL